MGDWLVCCWNTSSRCEVGGGGDHTLGGGATSSSAGKVSQYRAQAARPHPSAGSSHCQCHQGDTHSILEPFQWDVGENPSGADPEMKLSLRRSTLQQWVSRPTRHLVPFQSRSMMLVHPPAIQYIGL